MEVKQTRKARREEQTKLWWKKKEIKENKITKYMANERINKPGEYNENLHKVAQWKRNWSIEKKPIDYITCSRKTLKEHKERIHEDSAKPGNEQKCDYQLMNTQVLAIETKKHDLEARKQRKMAEMITIIVETIVRNNRRRQR